MRAKVMSANILTLETKLHHGLSVQMSRCRLAWRCGSSVIRAIAMPAVNFSLLSTRAEAPSALLVSIVGVDHLIVVGAVNAAA